MNSLDNSMFSESSCVYEIKKIINDLCDRDVIDVQLVSFNKKSKEIKGPSNCGSFIWYDGLFTSNFIKNKSRYEVRITGFKNSENIPSDFCSWSVDKLFLQRIPDFAKQ